MARFQNITSCPALCGASTGGMRMCCGKYPWMARINRAMTGLGDNLSTKHSLNTPSHCHARTCSGHPGQGTEAFTCSPWIAGHRQAKACRLNQRMRVRMRTRGPGNASHKERASRPHQIFGKRLSDKGLRLVACHARLDTAVIEQLQRPFVEGRQLLRQVLPILFCGKRFLPFQKNIGPLRQPDAKNGFRE